MHLWIIPAILVILLIVLSVFARKLFKILAMASLAVTIAAIVFGAFVVIDAKQFTEGFASKSNLFLFELNGSIVAGFRTTERAEEAQAGSPLGSVVTENEQYRKGAIESLGEGYYKVFVLRENATRNTSTIQLGDLNISMEEALLILASSQPKAEYLKIYVREKKTTAKAYEFSPSFGADQEFKGILFMFLFGKVLSDSNLITLYNEGSISIYPETLFLKVLKFVPGKTGFAVNKTISIGRN